MHTGQSRREEKGSGNVRIIVSSVSVLRTTNQQQLCPRFAETRSLETLHKILEVDIGLLRLGHRVSESEIESELSFGM